MQLILIQECQPVHTSLKHIIKTLTYLWLIYGVSSGDYIPLTLWRRNYFFLILAHPVYKM